MTTKPIPHGTPGGYTNHKCRCQECTAAWAKYHKDYIWRTGRATPQHTKNELAKANRKHGTLMKYRDGCRCDQCRAKSAESKRNQRARHAEHYNEYNRERRRRLKTQTMPSDATR